MPELSDMRDFWKPLQKFKDPEFYEDFDMAVKAYIQIDISNYLIKNMSSYIQAGYPEEELFSFVDKWQLSSLVKLEYSLHKLGASLCEFENLYSLEKALFETIETDQHAWSVDKLCRHYRSGLEKLILRHGSTTRRPLPNLFRRSARFNQLVSKSKSYRFHKAVAKVELKSQKVDLFERVKSFFLSLS